MIRPRADVSRADVTRADVFRASRDAEIRRLYRARPKDRFSRWSGLALGALTAISWVTLDLRPGELLSARRLANLERFSAGLWPYPLQGRELGPFERLVGLADWVVEQLLDRGLEAAATTLAMSIAAIVLAGIAGAAIAPLAARSLARAEPYLAMGAEGGWDGLAWRAGVAFVRAVLVLVRSIPEYVWAFLLLAVLGPTAWPVVLALALHNLGILAKLDAEVIENLEPRPLGALREAGASRAQIVLAGIVPLALPRFLLYFFYRWETCVREATVLGMLGVTSLGFWIVDARARQHDDEMIFFVLLGAALVLLGDLVSSRVRGWVRRAGSGQIPPQVPPQDAS